MEKQPVPMPRFDAPPVVETVMGVFFQPLPGFHVAARSLFWSTLKSEFPKIEEKPPVDEVREEFTEGGPPAGPQIRWLVGDALPSPRLWVKSEDGKHTLQLQQDALMVNWERDPAQSNYRPYADRRRDFAAKLKSLDEFLREKQIGSLVPTSCFATYINHVEYQTAADFASLMQRMMMVWSNETSDGWLPPVERANLQLSYVMPEKQGRLHVNIAPGLRLSDKNPIVRIDLTARGTPREKTLEGALAWIDLGHEWIVRGFTSLTRPEMHQQQHWKRTQ